MRDLLHGETKKLKKSCDFFNFLQKRDGIVVWLYTKNMLLLIRGSMFFVCSVCNQKLIAIDKPFDEVPICSDVLYFFSKRLRRVL